MSGSLERWEFAAGGGDSAGFNEGAIDIFQGRGNQALVREIIQNSADARASTEEPVRVVFSIFSVPVEETPEISTLRPVLERGRDARPKFSSADESQKRRDFYQGALQGLSQKTVRVLGIHDFNTTGLTGPTSFNGGRNDGPWWALVRSTGSNVKNRAGAGGSFGHGSKAPFAFGGLRTVFYYTCFPEAGDDVERFQGKIILESMPIPENRDLFTANTGYFGDVSNPQNVQPLTRGKIPAWAVTDRKKYGSGYGTSVYIPMPKVESEQSFWNECRIAVTGNFALAVREDIIRVSLGGVEEIDATTIQHTFRSVDKSRVSDDARARLESAETVLFGASGAEHWKGFGEVHFFSRTGDGISDRKVGIARSPAMLVTRAAEGLKSRFASTEPFDLFLWVKGDEGNSFLRGLENPAHDAFEFGFILDDGKRNAAERKYKVFQKNTRDLVRRLFGITAQERTPLSDLDFLLSAENLGEGTPADNGVADAPGISPIERPTSPSGAKSKKRATEGKRRRPRGERKPPRGLGGVADSRMDSVESGMIIAEGFRLVPISGHTTRATVHLDVPPKEYLFLELYRAGETVIDYVPCRVKVNGGPVGGVTRIPLKANQKAARMEIPVDFLDPSDLRGASRLVAVLR